MKLTVEQLKRAASELNAALGLEPQIDLSWDESLLIMALKKVSKLIEPTDDFSKETWEVLFALGELPPKVIKAKADFITYVRTTPASIEVEVEEHVAKAEEPEEEKPQPAEKVEETKEETEKKIEEVASAVSEKPTKKRSPLIAFLEEKIREGKYTQAELVKMALEKFGDQYKKNTLSSVIIAGRIPKQCRFEYIAMPDENKRIRFTKLRKKELVDKGIETWADLKAYLEKEGINPFE